MGLKTKAQERLIQAIVHHDPKFIAKPKGLLVPKIKGLETLDLSKLPGLSKPK